MLTLPMRRALRAPTPRAQKKSSVQFKALDNVIQTVNRETGQREALSYRCADIDRCVSSRRLLHARHAARSHACSICPWHPRIVPGLMGVSRAVLESVIFVHQEDSNWPLAEGQASKRTHACTAAGTNAPRARAFKQCALPLCVHHCTACRS